MGFESFHPSQPKSMEDLLAETKKQPKPPVSEQPSTVKPVDSYQPPSSPDTVFEGHIDAIIPSGEYEVDTERQPAMPPPLPDAASPETQYEPAEPTLRRPPETQRSPDTMNEGIKPVAAEDILEEIEAPPETQRSPQSDQSTKPKGSI